MKLAIVAQNGAMAFLQIHADGLNVARSNGGLMAERAMLDVSMLAHRGTLQRIFRLARQKPEALAGLCISQAFFALVEKRGGSDRDLIKRISRYFMLPPSMIDLKLMRAFFKTRGFKYLEKYSSEREKIRSEYQVGQVIEDSEIARVVMEEWQFLMTHSWLFAKTRAIYEHIINAGGKAIYTTKQKLGKAIESTKQAAQGAIKSTQEIADRLINRTLKKPAGNELSPNDRVCAMGKWIAVGGAGATSLMLPLLGAAVGVAAGMFLLYDP
jgi:hypothetical protein